MQPQAKVTWSYQKLEEASKYSPLGPSEGRWPCQQPWFKTSGLQNFADHLSCDPQTRFFVPPNIKQWIALLQGGNCTFKEKISQSAFHNAVAAVIYDNKSKEEPVTMTHRGTWHFIAVMITELRGKDILSYLEKNISVQMTIAVGTRMLPKNFSRGSLVFMSISFIILMIISSAWLIFYFIQKIRYTNARDRNQKNSN